MSKIIDFSSSYEEQCVVRRMDAIKQELKKAHLSNKKLRALQQELYHLSLQLTETLEKGATLTQYAMSEFLTSQAEVGVLLYDCQNLFIDKKVDSLTTHAQKIAKASLDPYQNLSQKIAKMHRSILSLTEREALSLENRQMIHLAKKYLHDAEARACHEAPFKDAKTIRLDFKKANVEKNLTDAYDLSLELYEIAGYVYHSQMKEARALFLSLAPTHQERLHHLMQQQGPLFAHLEGPSLDLTHVKEDLYKIMQVLLGYSHELLYGAFSMPTVHEVEELFQDLEASMQEGSANF